MIPPICILTARPAGKLCGGLSELTILAASAIDTDGTDSCVTFRLARDACPDAGQGLPAALGNVLAAIVAIFRAFADRHHRSRALNSIIDRIVDLILHRAIGCPTICHRVDLQIPKWRSGALSSRHVKCLIDYESLFVIIMEIDHGRSRIDRYPHGQAVCAARQ